MKNGSTDNIIQVTGLDVSYGKKRVLEGLDLTVPAGSVTGLLGHNGVGKSTLLRVLAAEISARAGTVSVLGLDPCKRPTAVKRAIGWVPDQVELPRWMRVDDHMRLLRPFYPGWDRSEEARLLGFFGLHPRAKIAELSKGQRTLAALIAALAHHPRLLLLDEPFSGLDPFARRHVFEGVLDHLREEGKSVLVVSHSIADLERCTDRIAVLDGGRITTCEDIEELRMRTARIHVTLDPDSVPWFPPGAPIVEDESADMRTLFYVDWNEELHAELTRDESVRDVEFLPRDLEDMLVATVEEGRSS